MDVESEYAGIVIGGYQSGAFAVADKTVDTRGLTCPLPILKAKKAIAAVPAGGTLEVLATDPGSKEDFEVFARTTGHELLDSSEHAGVFRFLLRRRD